MKLVDILARELKQWPEDSVVAVQDADGEVKFSDQPAAYLDAPGLVWISRGYGGDESFKAKSGVSDDYRTAIVTRAQWQAAVEGLKSPSLHIQQIGRITRQQETIDWPEWATHRLTTGPNWDGDQAMIGSIEFAALRGDSYHDHWGGEFRMGDSSWVVLGERHSVAWNGEGLPPVGLKVEGQIDGCSEWIPLTLRYVSTDFSVFEKADGNEFPLWNPQYAKFRPIRTPEQIAAEEREAELNRMVATAKMLDKGWARKVCAELYDAGYRKQVQP